MCGPEGKEGFEWYNEMKYCDHCEISNEKRAMEVR
jgi:hypothetical protein